MVARLSGNGGDSVRKRVHVALAYLSIYLRRNASGDANGDTSQRARVGTDASL